MNGRDRTRTNPFGPSFYTHGSTFGIRGRTLVVVPRTTTLVPIWQRLVSEFSRFVKHVCVDLYLLCTVHRIALTCPSLAWPSHLPPRHQLTYSGQTDIHMGTDTATTTIHASKGRCLEYLIGIQTRPARYWEVSLDVPRCLTIREELNVARVLLSLLLMFSISPLLRLFAGFGSLMRTRGVCFVAVSLLLRDSTELD